MSSPLEPKYPIMGDFLEKFSLPDKPSNSIPEIPPFLDEMPENSLMETYTLFVS